MSKRVKNRKGKSKGKFNRQFMKERERRIANVAKPGHSVSPHLNAIGGVLKW